MGRNRIKQSHDRHNDHGTPRALENGGNMQHRSLFSTLVIAGLLAAAHPSAAQFIAGVKPEQRPENAPVITEFKKDGAWYARALTGVLQPYPDSLQFLEDQGAWFNPFINPGMHAPYDIRGWHEHE